MRMDVRQQIYDQLCDDCKRIHSDFPHFPEYHAIHLDRLCPKCYKTAMKIIGESEK